jgi:mRNA interferase MazF
LLRNVCVAAVTSTIRDLPTEVLLGQSHGLARECVVNCDNLFTLPKTVLGRFRGSLAPEEVHELNGALKIALDLD